MHQFSFVIHPLELKRDAARKYPILKFFPEKVVEQIALRISPKLMSEITGVQSALGAQAQGWFVGCPLSAKQLVTLPDEVIYQHLVAAGHFSAQMGAKVMGLGAFTSVAGDAGITVAKRLEGVINVTSGNSYTVFTAVEGLIKAAKLMDHDVSACDVAIVGATGSIGAVCAKILASQVGSITLIGRDEAKLERVKAEVEAQPDNRATTRISTDIRAALREADLILAVSAAGKELIFPEDLKVGAVVCDVARPRDVSKRVVEERDDVLVIEGGVIAVPGPVNFNLNFGFPDKTAYACMSETMLMALEGTYQPYTLGREISVSQVERVGELARKHGFELAGFRSFEKAVDEREVLRVRDNARRRAK